jgi:L-amino acid N-acyltransferase YncA
MTDVHVRAAGVGDATALARIFNQGIGERVATFETNEQGPDRFVSMIEAGAVVLAAELGNRVVGWASIGPYSDPADYYSGVGEATLYVDRDARRAGVGCALLDALADAARHRGYHKLVGKLFTTNEPSAATLRAAGWREVGTHLRHGRLEGEWKDVLVVEKLLG